MRVALTIAGSDSGGGAGIQADLKTFYRFGVFGTSAITAVTAQNTRGVDIWEPVSSELVRAQIGAVASDLDPAAVKSGMLGTARIISVIAEEIRDLPNYVLDPVMVATSGDLLIHRDAIRAIEKELIPLATLITPNSDEASVLVGFPVKSIDQMRAAVDAISMMGARNVLLKGGHLPQQDTVVDLFYDGDDFTEFHHPFIDTTNTHGTGCTLSAAIAANLALGLNLAEAVKVSIDFVHEAIATAPNLGSGHGPLNHFAASPATNSRTIA
jgi:hydroxymethylpyrimidine/phosphomethylpyrimidine kinase